MAVRVRPDRSARSIIPWLFPAGLGLVVVVNMVMAWFAVDTFPGVATRNAYERGRNYGQVLERDAEIAALGWQVDIRLRSDAGDLLVVRYRDRKGQPVIGLQPLAVLTRPLGEAARIGVRLQESEAGAYQATLALPYRGQWDAQVSVDGQATPHVAAVRLNAR